MATNFPPVVNDFYGYWMLGAHGSSNLASPAAGSIGGGTLTTNPASGKVGGLTCFGGAQALGSMQVPINFLTDRSLGTCSGGDARSNRCDASWIGFSSRHDDGANFVFMDGSVRFIGQDVDPAVRMQLGTMSGGEQSDLPLQ